MNPTPSFAAVVVTFFPDEELGQRLAAIAREFPDTLVVDNSGSPEIAGRVAALCASLRCDFIANPLNVGLARALNTGFAAHHRRGVSHGVAFDQDSAPVPGFAAALRQRLVNEPGLAIVGANWHDEGRPGEPSRHLRRHPAFPLFFQRPPAITDLDNVTCVITSGTAFVLAAWQELGGFDESLFLDLVDTEYCLRARSRGHTIGVAAEARLAHRRGAKRPVTFLGRTAWPAFMPPRRLRYLFRNRVLVLSQLQWRDAHWVAFELVYALKILAEVLLLEDHKREKLAACLRGTWDGLWGKDGPLP